NLALTLLAVAALAALAAAAPAWAAPGAAPRALLETIAALNFSLAVVNAVPVPPLDGSRVLEAWLPARVEPGSRAVLRAGGAARGRGVGGRLARRADAVLAGRRDARSARRDRRVVSRQPESRFALVRKRRDSSASHSARFCSVATAAVIDSAERTFSALTSLNTRSVCSIVSPLRLCPPVSPTIRRRESPVSRSALLTSETPTP